MFVSRCLQTVVIANILGCLIHVPYHIHDHVVKPISGQVNRLMTFCVLRIRLEFKDLGAITTTSAQRGKTLNIF